jgi:hypothetical protein
MACESLSLAAPLGIDAMMQRIINGLFNDAPCRTRGVAYPEMQCFSVLIAWRLVVCDAHLIEERSQLTRCIRGSASRGGAVNARGTNVEGCADTFPGISIRQAVTKLNLTTPGDLTEKMWKREPSTQTARIQHLVDAMQPCGFFYYTHIYYFQYF